MRVNQAWAQQRWLRLVVTACLVYAYIWLCGPSPPAHEDTINDYVFARTCVEGLGCEAHDTSVGGLVQSRLLIVALSSMLGLGLAPTLQHLVFIALTALGVAVVADLARDLAGELAGLSAAVLGAWALPAAAGHPLLWNPTLASLPLALVTVGCARLAGDARPRLWSLAIALGIVGAYHGHVVHLLVWPVACVLVGALTEDRVARGVVALGPCIGLAAFDREVLAANAQAILLGPGGFLVPVVLLVGVVLGASLRARWLEVDAERRALVALAGLAGTIVAVVGAGALLGDLNFTGRYVAAAVPAMVVLLACVPATLDRRAGVVISILVAVWSLRGLAVARSETQAWTFADVEALDAELRAHAGVSLAELGAQLRAPGAQDLVNAVRALGPELAARAGDGGTVQVLLVDAEGCASLDEGSGWRCVVLGRGRRAVWTREPAPWTDPAGFDACVQRGAEASVDDCVRVDVGDPRHDRRFGAPRHVAFGGEASLWIQRLRVRVGAEGERHMLLAAGWRLRGASGVEVEEGPTIGARQRLLLHGRPGTEGRLILDYEVRGSEVAPATIAVAVELGPEDVDLLAHVLD